MGASHARDDSKYPLCNLVVEPWRPFFLLGTIRQFSQQSDVFLLLATP
jgi:hypothetical protein